MAAKRLPLNTALQQRHARSLQAKRPQRKIVCKILIVCEGAKTEPNYFSAFQRDNRGTQVYDMDIETKGLGANTTYVVVKAIELRDAAKQTRNEYDRVWAVFDRDSFDAEQFNNAIIKAESNGISCAWSNESFEPWFLYHFSNQVVPMNRKDYKEAISAAVNKSTKHKQAARKDKYVYQKNADNYTVVTTYVSQSDAIRWAEAKSKEYKDKKYANHNPCTMVFKLVRQLIGEDNELNDELRDKI